MDCIDFSIIIPVYNVDKYLRRCVDSVLRQENALFEVILVDDGSSDLCPEICDEYSEKDSRVQVIHKENAGLGYARNSGLEVAQGRYIFFLDSDDWIPEKTLELLKALINKYDVDIIAFKYKRTYEKDYFPINNEREELEKLVQPDIMEAYLDGKISSSACAKLYKKSIFDCLKFSSVSLHEDAYSMHLFLQAAQSLLITNQIYYVQYVRPKSLMQSSFSGRNFISIKCGERLVKFVNEFYPAYNCKALEMLLSRQLNILDLIIKCNAYRRYKKQYLKIVLDIKSEVKILPCDQISKEALRKDIDFLLGHPVIFIVKKKIIMTREKIGMAKIRLIQNVIFVFRKF